VSLACLSASSGLITAFSGDLAAMSRRSADSGSVKMQRNRKDECVRAFKLSSD
jgi:hypothetical protein